MKKQTYFSLKGSKAERIVQDLAVKTFLTDWCYMNPVLPDNKELCDLLVVYDEIAVIWQIKDLKLNEKGRYRSREVKKNLRQLSGARRQLFALDKPIELENPRRGKEAFNPKEIKDIYLIAVLLGEGEDAFAFVEHIHNYTVHVFTRDFTQIVLNELDTVTDFINYLRIKEALINDNRRFVILGGEEELLAIYLMNNRNFDSLEDANLIMIDVGTWKKLRNSAKYIEKKKQDEISYGWDGIINEIHKTSPEYEIVARELARPNRFERRCLGKAYLEACIRADTDNENNVFRRTFDLNGVTYCFLFADEAKPRDYRRGMLRWMCYIARGIYKSNRKVLGIATEKKMSKTCSYDFLLLEMPKWTKQDQKEMERAQKEYGIFLTPEIKTMHEDEYS